MADQTLDQQPAQSWLAAIPWKRLQSPWTVTLLIPVLVYFFDTDSLGPFLAFAMKAFMGTLPYILFAVALISYLKAAGAEGMIAKAFEGREVSMIFMAALFGGLAPFCSCEVIPFVAGLLAVGAPISAVMAFWLSSPLIDPPTLVLTANALGWDFAIAKAIAAVALGLFGGFIMMAASRAGAYQDILKPYKASGCCGLPKLDPNKTNWRPWTESDRRQVFWGEAQSNAQFLIKWLAMAYILESAMVLYVSQDVISQFLSQEGGIVSIVLAALIGMPAYLNSYVAPPFVSGLVAKGMGIGAGMSFILAGAISSIPAMAAVWALVKPRVFFSYIALGLSGAIIGGVLYQLYAGI